MAPKELPARVAELMLLQGAVVAFGPDSLEDSLRMLEELKDALAGKAFLSGERIDDLAIPDGPVLNALLIFFHRMPAHMTQGAWQAALLKDAVLRGEPPKGLGVADRSPEDPAVELAAVGRDEMQLIVTWQRPLEARRLVEAARSIERAYIANGGGYAKPGLFKRLRGLLP